MTEDPTKKLTQIRLSQTQRSGPLVLLTYSQGGKKVYIMNITRTGV